jgi:Uma2 family endonuclease
MTAVPDLAASVSIHRLLYRDDLTVDDITSLPEDLRYELIDGRLVLSPYAVPVHQTLSILVADAIRVHLRRPFVLNLEQALLVDRRNELRPDVMVFSREGARRSPVPAAYVHLVVEVISPSSKSFDRGDKLKRYADAGVPLYWLVDPLTERVTFSEFALGPDGTYGRRVHTDQRVTVDEPWSITLDPPAWTEERDWMMGTGDR